MIAVLKVETISHNNILEHRLSCLFSIGSAIEECEPCATVKCNSGCATTVPRLLVIEGDIV